MQSTPTDSLLAETKTAHSYLQPVLKIMKANQSKNGAAFPISIMLGFGGK